MAKDDNTVRVTISKTIPAPPTPTVLPDNIGQAIVLGLNKIYAGLHLVAEAMNVQTHEMRALRRALERAGKVK